MYAYISYLINNSLPFSLFILQYKYLMYICITVLYTTIYHTYTTLHTHIHISYIYFKNLILHIMSHKTFKCHKLFSHHWWKACQRIYYYYTQHMYEKYCHRCCPFHTHACIHHRHTSVSYPKGISENEIRHSEKGTYLNASQMAVIGGKEYYLNCHADI